MGRIAAKDAVRRWLWARGEGPLFPVEITIETDGHGRPTVNVPGPSTVCVSIAHKGDIAVAFAHKEAVGIDVEIIEPRSSALEMIALSAQERSLLDRIVSESGGDPQRARSAEFTRFWAAKEAVSKAEGTGLEGRPTAFAVSAVEGDRLRIVCHGEPATPKREYEVDTCIIVGSPNAHGGQAHYVVAWTHANSALRMSNLDQIATAPSTALPQSTHAARTINVHGGNYP
jgi:phosphopantetheinyl transferase